MVVILALAYLLSVLVTFTLATIVNVDQIGRTVMTVTDPTDAMSPTPRSYVDAVANLSTLLMTWTSYAGISLDITVLERSADSFIRATPSTFGDVTELELNSVTADALLINSTTLPGTHSVQACLRQPGRTICGPALVVTLPNVFESYPSAYRNNGGSGSLLLAGTTTVFPSSTPYYIEAWQKITTAGGNPGIYFSSRSSSYKFNFIIRCQAGTFQLYSADDYYTSSASCDIAYLDTWTHGIIQIDGQTISLYMNGVLLHLWTVTTAPQSGNNQLLYGSNWMNTLSGANSVNANYIKGDDRLAYCRVVAGTAEPQDLFNMGPVMKDTQGAIGPENDVSVTVIVGSREIVPLV